MLPFIILGAVNAYIFLNTGKKVEQKDQSKKVQVRGPFMVRHGVGGPRNS